MEEKSKGKSTGDRLLAAGRTIGFLFGGSTVGIALELGLDALPLIILSFVSYFVSIGVCAFAKAWILDH